MSSHNEGAEPLTVTVNQAIALTNLGPVTIYKYLKLGQLEGTKVGGRRLIYFASLKKLVGIAATAA